MTIKQQGGIFGRNPSFNEVDANQVGIGLDDPKGALHVKLGSGYSAGNTWNTGSAVFGGEAATDGALGLTYNNTDGSILASIIPLVAWKPVKVHASQFSVFVNGSTNVATVDGDGLKFNGDTAAANALDDYEEGTFTPTAASSSGTITSYTVNSGVYTKVGRMVFVNVDITITDAGTGSGSFDVSLPFTNGSSLCNGTGRENALTGYQLQTRVNASSATMNIQTYANATAIGTNAQIKAMIVYFV